YVLLFFSSSSSGHHRLLHSFPTRRSSDLSTARDILASLRPCARRCDPVPTGVSLVPIAADLRGGEQPRHVAHRRAHDEFRGFREDRKSTRLNSSHDQISYAVFCLKKKKTK